MTRQPNALQTQTRKNKNATIQRDAEAYEAWLSGASFRAIARALDVSHQTAANMVKRALDRLLADTVATMQAAQQKELSRLDRLIASVWNEAVRGKLDAVAEARQLIMSRARILGLLTPELHIHQHRTSPEERGTSAADLVAQKIDELAERRKMREAEG